MSVIPAVLHHILRSRADRCPPKIQRGYSHPRRARAPEGTVDVAGTGADNALRSSCGTRHATRE